MSNFAIITTKSLASKGKIATGVRFFYSSSLLCNPSDKDVEMTDAPELDNKQETSDNNGLIAKIDELSQESSKLGAQVKDVKDYVYDEEYVEGDSEATTELCKTLITHSARKDRVEASYQRAIDATDSEDVTRQKALELAKVEKSLEIDLKSARVLVSELAEEDEAWDVALDLGEKLENLKTEVENLKKDLGDNVLPPISDEDTNTFPQDSSDVYQTEFDSSDYYED